MGTSQSIYGGAIIRTDKPFYFAGDMITGNIYINIIKEGFPAQNVWFTLTGKEKCSWEESYTEFENDSDGNGQHTVTKYYTHKGQNQFYNNRVQVWNFNSPSLPIGDFVVPFKFQLQQYLPGSFYEKGKNYCAKISYRIKVEIQSLNNNKKNIKNIQEIILREQIQVNKQLGEKKSVDVVNCCKNKGTASLNLVFNSKSYLSGEKAIISIEVDNSQCKAAITQIKAKLKNTLILKSDSWNSKVLDRSFSYKAMNGVEKEKIVNMSMELELLNTKDQIHLKPSTKGSKIQSKYSIQVLAYFQGCCSEEIFIEVPIQIVASVPPQMMQPLEKPPNWNPQILETKNFQIISSNQLTKEDKKSEESKQITQQTSFDLMCKPMN